MITAAVYARKSTEQSGVADDLKSVARQIQHARAYAKRNGWVVPEEHIYVDDGISGAEFAARPGFVRLMSALKPRPPFQVLVMSEVSRLGRESIETSFTLKQLSLAGVKCFSYLENRELLMESAIDKFLLGAVTFAADLEREKARQRVHDAMSRKARAGHNCGGRTFGYHNRNVPGPTGERAYVTYEVNDVEAAVIRHIFALAAQGDGLKAITKRLNAEGALAPRPQQGRTRAWAPSSVRDILHREMYRGRRVWNKTQKRDKWGQQRQHDRPQAEWLTVACEELRIVTDAQWLAAHQRIQMRRAAHDRWKRGDVTGAANGQGVRTRYFLSGFARCACGASIQAVSRLGKGGQRVFKYCCASYWNRGAAVCANGRTVDMLVADQAIQTLLKDTVLQPRIVGRALDRALDQYADQNGSLGQREPIAKRLRDLEAELANLSELIAMRGAVPAVLDAIARRETERQRLAIELQALDVVRPVSLDRAGARTRIKTLLNDFRAMLSADMAKARPVLSVALAGDRITFAPLADGTYELRVPIAFDRMMGAAIPELAGLQDVGTSPDGTEHILRAEYRLILPAAA